MVIVTFLMRLCYGRRRLIREDECRLSVPATTTHYARQYDLSECRGNARATTLGHGLDSTIIERIGGPRKSIKFWSLLSPKCFDRIGYYDESFDACEDVEFNFRVFRAGLPSYLSSRLSALSTAADVAFAMAANDSLRRGRTV